MEGREAGQTCNLPGRLSRSSAGCSALARSHVSSRSCGIEVSSGNSGPYRRGTSSSSCLGCTPSATYENHFRSSSMHSRTRKHPGPSIASRSWVESSPKIRRFENLKTWNRIHIMARAVQGAEPAALAGAAQTTHATAAGEIHSISTPAACVQRTAGPTESHARAATSHWEHCKDSATGVTPAAAAACATRALRSAATHRFLPYKAQVLVISSYTADESQLGKAHFSSCGWPCSLLSTCSMISSGSTDMGAISG